MDVAKNFSISNFPISAPRRASPVYMTFQPARFIRPDCCQPTPCALTAHFHPYQAIADCRIADFGLGMLLTCASVALGNRTYSLIGISRFPQSAIPESAIKWRLFSVTLSVRWPSPTAHPLGGAVPYVVRTFLPSPCPLKRTNGQGDGVALGAGQR